LKKFLFPLLSSLLLLACQDENKEPENEVDDSLQFSIKTIEKSLDNCKPEHGECTFISLIFPEAENGMAQAEEINAVIEQFLSQTLNYQENEIPENPEELATNFIQNYKETAEEFPKYELPWEATINGKVMYENEQLIAMKFNTDMFTGGAHGYRSTRYFNFDAETGKLLRSEELFTSDFIDYVEKDFRKKHNIPMDKDINSTGFFFEKGYFRLPLDIGFTEDKVILHYNAYEIAPYATGSTILSYPRSEIESFLKLKSASKG
tara:strand:+ start:1508 stop:2296 length:789 start_codon:yes stop_codon:yes gene_type:complete